MTEFEAVRPSGIIAISLEQGDLLGWVHATTGAQDVIIVSARGRAKVWFDFDYVWEVYKPAHQRRWGYYTLPILYGDRLVARFDPKLDRTTNTLLINGLWLNRRRWPKIRNSCWLARGLQRFKQFLNAQTIGSPR
jgi:uncharacterized protein YcaQ